MGDFSRFLPDDLMTALRTDPLAQLLSACKPTERTGLDLRLRSGYVSAYDGAASLAKLGWARGQQLGEGPLGRHSRLGPIDFRAERVCRPNDHQLLERLEG
jgi:hypothetical protein